MGMHDTLVISCPRCGEETEFQSKAGPCSMTEYQVYDAPLAILAVVAGERFDCPGCEKPFTVNVQFMTNVRPL